MSLLDRPMRWSITAPAIVFAAAALSAQAPDSPSFIAADRAFEEALAQANASAALELLDADVTWTDAEGRTLNRTEIGQNPPTPAMATDAGAYVRRFDYGRIGVAQIDKGPLHALRVWINRSGNWRVLVYQEVRSLADPPTVTPGTGADCVNPCRTVPYTPRNDDERGVIAAYQALETAAHAIDVANWGTHVAHEFVLVSSNANRTFDKTARLDGLRRASKGGVSPTRLLTAQMIGGDGVVVMRSQHEPDAGDRLQVTRVWVKRDGVWQSTLSYQTSERP
jgi:hypothetical protein